MKEQFRIETQPVADPANVVRGEHYRITVLETGLVRLEWSDDGVFEDRASQTVLHRAFAPVDFTVTESDHHLEISTERYRQPRVNPLRVALRIQLTRLLGNVGEDTTR